MFIGEGPGYHEDQQGLPFVGPAGQLLDKMLASIGLYRDKNCFIANIVKCRPPSNRDPLPEEAASCRDYLLRQIQILKPKIILSVGRIPTQFLLNTSEGITKLRGKLMDFQGIPFLPTFHPSALLRDENLKRPAWEDLKLLRKNIDELQDNDA
jgi:DNA polymerase